jgi:hypothetical protein
VTPAPPLDDGAFWGPHPVAAIAPEELKTLSVILPRGRTLLDAAGAGYGMPGEAAWWRQTAQAVIETDSPEELASAQLGGHTVLSAALLHDDDFEADIGWGSMALLWLAADPDDPDEITRWWNTRALRPRRWHKGMSVLATPDAVADGRFATDLRSFCLHGCSLSRTLSSPATASPRRSSTTWPAVWGLPATRAPR